MYLASFGSLQELRIHPDIYERTGSEIRDQGWAAAVELQMIEMGSADTD